MILAKVHFWIGLVGILVFVLTGQYMDYVHVELMEDRPRMFYRSAHIYLLLAFLINLFAGVYFRIDERNLIKFFQLVISVIILICPFLFLVAFFLEEQHALEGFERPYSSLASYLLFGVGLVLCLQAFFAHRD